jgi:hypothetical protein
MDHLGIGPNFGPNWVLHEFEEMQLELAATQALVNMLLDYVARRVPPDDPSSPLARYLAAAGDAARVDRIVTIADEHLAAGRRDKMILLLREETGARWDHLDRLANRWSSLARDARRAWVRGAVLRKVLGASSERP